MAETDLGDHLVLVSKAGEDGVGLVLENLLDLVIRVTRAERGGRLQIGRSALRSFPSS